MQRLPQRNPDFASLLLYITIAIDYIYTITFTNQVFLRAFCNTTGTLIIRSIFKMEKIPVRHIVSNPKEPDLSENFSIRDLQDLLAGNDMLQHLHRHDFFYMLVLQKGSGKHQIDFVPYNICDNSIFFMRPGQVHELHLKAGSTGYLMQFTAKFYHPNNKLSTQRLLKASHKTFCKPDLKRFEKLYSILTYILQEENARQEGFRDIIKANLDIFFIEFVRQSQDPEKTSPIVTSYTQQRLEEFIGLLETHIADCKQVSGYAALLNLSTYQLNAITKEALGKTPSELINEHILLEAKRQLLATSSQVNQIADHLGYEDVSYFIRFFKKHTGHSPEAFRNNQG